MPIDPKAMTAAQIRALFATGAIESQRAFVRACPAGRFRDDVAGLVVAAPRETTLRALNVLCDEYSRGAEASLASTIGTAVFALARKFHEADSANAPLLDAAGRAAVIVARALAATGRHDKVIAFVSDAAAWLAARQQNAAVGELLLFLADAHRHRAQFDAARAALDRAAPLLGPERPYERERLLSLREQIERLAGRSATELPSAPPPEAGMLRDFNRAAAAEVGALADRARENPEVLRAASELLAKLPDPEVPATRQEWVKSTKPLMQQLSELVSGGAGGEMNRARNKARIRSANMILIDEREGHDPEKLAEARAFLLVGEAWARDNGFIDDADGALWGLYLCHNRTNAVSEAIANLQKLWRSLEEVRAATKDPFKRAGVFAEFPRLFGMLCRLLCKTGRLEEMLAAAEASKGRVIEDVLVANDRAESIVRPKGLAGRVRKALVRLRAHYLSFVVDREATYAILVTRRGVLHAHEIPIDRAALRQYADWVDPRRWGSRPFGFYEEPIPTDVLNRLAPLVSWLAPLFADGTIKPDDHICYSPDDDLFLVPLHYLPVAGGLLIDHCSVSRLHHASGLERLAARKARRPKRYVGVYVPAVQDRREPGKLADLRRPIKWLAKRFEGRQLSGGEADVEAVAEENLSARVVHFAAHGTFPRTIREGEAGNPFHRSGLVLAHGGGLPSLVEVHDTHLLSPARVMSLDASASHVTLQACISGLTRGGVGGDALGLEWAFMLRGADSILSTHWDVPAKQTAAFCSSFYEHWLAARESRAAAWRRTCLAFRASGGALADPYCWASFSLSGDWR